MKLFTIDLYDYFKVKKPENGVGILTCFVQENSVEINPNRKQPAMLVIPGGGYSMTSFREKEPVALKFLSYGFSCFALEYSCAPVRYPYPLVEAVMAMEYIRKNANELHIDPDMVASVGFSAGGHLCGMLGSYDKRDEVYSIFKHSDNVKPNASILSYPVVTSTEPTHGGSFDSLCGDNEKLRKELSLENLINKNSAPAFIWTTYEDNAVPFRNSLIAANAYSEAGVRVSIHLFNKGIHGLSVADMSVYGREGDFSGMSKSVYTWPELAKEWLAELGIKNKSL